MKLLSELLDLAADKKPAAVVAEAIETSAEHELLFERDTAMSGIKLPPLKTKISIEKIHTTLLTSANTGFGSLKDKVYGVKNESPMIDALIELLGVPEDGTAYKIRNGFMTYDKGSKMLFIAKFKDDLPKGWKITEAKNHMGEVEYRSFSAWKSACKKINPEVWFDGNQDISNAFVGTRPYRRKETRSIGEWDGETGAVFQDVPKAAAPGKKEKSIEEGHLVENTEAVILKQIEAKLAAKGLQDFIHDGSSIESAYLTDRTWFIFKKDKKSSIWIYFNDKYNLFSIKAIIGKKVEAFSGSLEHIITIAAMIFKSSLPLKHDV
jgi:hypothetical protein